MGSAGIGVMSGDAPPGPDEPCETAGSPVAGTRRARNRGTGGDDPMPSGAVGKEAHRATRERAELSPRVVR